MADPGGGTPASPYKRLLRLEPARLTERADVQVLGATDTKSQRTRPTRGCHDGAHGPATRPGQLPEEDPVRIGAQARHLVPASATSPFQPDAGAAAEWCPAPNQRTPAGR